MRELREDLFRSHASQKSHLAGDRMIAHAFEFERSRDRARSGVSAAPRVGDASTAGVGVAADFRAVATVGASGGSRVGWSVTRVRCVHARATDAIRPTCEEACVRGARCHDVRVIPRAASISSESGSEPCPSLRNMARDSRRVVDDGGGGGGSGGGATVRCKLLVLSVLLLAIVLPAAYADSQGESRRQFLIVHATCVSCYVRGCR